MRRAMSVLALVAVAYQDSGMALPAGSPQLSGMRSENIAAIAVAPDGNLVATGERAALVKLWDARTRTLQRRLHGHTAPVSSLAFSADGKQLASGSFDQWIRVWDLESGRSTLTLGEHPGHVKSLAFSSDGRLLASTGADGIRVWDLASGSLRRTWPSQRGVVAAVFSPDRGVLASAGGEGVKLWDVAAGSVTRSLASGTEELILTLAFSPDGRWLAGGGTGRTVKLWDARTGTLRRTSAPGHDFVRALAFSDDGSTVVVADRTAARLWDTGTGEMRPMLDDARFSVVAVSSDGRALAAAEGDEVVRVLPVK